MNIKIKDIAYCHPKNKVSNEQFIKHFDLMDINIRGLLKASVRENRYISDNPKETTLTMAIEASKRVLEKSKLTGQDIDLIVFTSDSPEYFTPTNALRIHHAIDGKKSATVYDLNCNCLGMIVGVDQVSKIMQVDKNINRALIIGSQQLQHYAKEGDTNPLVKVMFGDMACAVVLEKTKDTNSYFIDNLTYTDSSLEYEVQFPINGLSNLNSKPEMAWFSVDNEKAFNPVPTNLKILMKRNNIDKSMIKKYYLSQMSLSNIRDIADRLEETEDKFVYIGDEYGYTGTCSPFLALAKSLKNGDLKRGDYILLWSIAGGITTNAILMRY